MAWTVTARSASAAQNLPRQGFSGDQTRSGLLPPRHRSVASRDQAPGASAPPEPQRDPLGNECVQLLARAIDVVRPWPDAYEALVQLLTAYDESRRANHEERK